VLVFGPLRVSNRESYTQLVYSLIPATDPLEGSQIYAGRLRIKTGPKPFILDACIANPVTGSSEVTGH